MQNWILKKPAASSLAPSDKYHKNPQGGHRHTTTGSGGGGGGETSNNHLYHPGSSSANNNNNNSSRHNSFSHNGIPPPSCSTGAGENPEQKRQYEDQLILQQQSNNSSSYHFYPSYHSVGSSSISSSSHLHPHHPHHHQQLNNNHRHPQQQQPPYLVYKSNHSSSGGSSSGNGSHIIIEGSGGAAENKKQQYYYYYNGHYYPTTGEEVAAAAAAEEEDPDQIFTITAFTSGSGNEIVMGRVGQDMYPPGSPASIGKGGGGGGSGLFKSKSSSIPVTSGGSPIPHHHHQRGFRDTFISSMSPPVQVHSAESSPLHRSASAATASSSYSASVNSGGGGGNNKHENKKWSFGGLFRRNKSVKSGSTSALGNNNSIGGGVEANNATASSANNSHCNSPAKVNNNNYGGSAGGSPIISRTAASSSYSPVITTARPASSVGFISADPNGDYRRHHHHHHRPNTIVSSSTPPKFVNAESQTRAKGKLSESDISTCDSDLELELAPHHHDNNPPEPAPQENKGYKQNFLVRRLSRRKEKAAAKKAAAAASASSASIIKTGASATSNVSNRQIDHNSSNGFISSSSQQQQQQHELPQMKRRVGSSPDSLNNSSEPWPSWETTKKPQQTQLQALQQQHRLLQNYSSNGSLSLSQEGYNSNANSSATSNNHPGSKSSRAAAAREAVKARAIARRESFLHDSSSSSDEEEDTEERGSQRSSLQGSFSSLNSRNRRQRAFNMQQAQFQQQRHLFPATATSQAAAAGGISCASPSSPMPVPLDYRNSVSGTSPNMNRRLMAMGPPGSPKWEARVIYQQQQQQQQDGTTTASSPPDQQPIVVRLPRKERMNGGVGGGSGSAIAGNPSQMSQNNGDQGFIMATEMISEDQHVVTAGLKVPFLPVQNQPQPADQQSFLRNGQLMYPDDPVQYANVANGMRGRSCTPYMGYNNSTSSGVAGGGGGAIHHASPTPPPPPPPRRDFTTVTSNPNFYRPVSCSYLDSYANQLQQMSEQQQQHHNKLLLRQQQQQHQQAPIIFNGNYIYPHHHPVQGHQEQQQQPEVVMNGFASQSANPVHNLESLPVSGIARSSPRHFAPAAAAAHTNVDDARGASRHPPLIRSPSEPPVIRGEQSRKSISSSPSKRLISSPMSNGSGGGGGNNNGESHLVDGSGKSSPAGKSGVITSKLGFPVRRLQESSGGSQSPRVSEFWRRKETQATGSPSPVSAALANNQQQKNYLSRIRSADSSPLPKMRKSPGGGGGGGGGGGNGLVASNESISSLSSFSENATSPGPPKNCSSPIAKQVMFKALPSRAQISKTPNPQQLTYGNNTDKENNNNSGNNGHQPQSAVERLKVRIPSAPAAAESSKSSAANNELGASNNPIRALVELNNGKTPGRNLEDALNELEDMYKSLRLSDEDLLNRAERRDLPTQHQMLRDAPLIPIPQAYHRFEKMGSVESLGTGGSSGGTNYSGEQQQQRVRAPSVRRSSRPDTVSDDMANRRLAFPDGKPLDPRVVVAKTGSYLARSPAFSPCTSPCPPEAGGHHHKAAAAQAYTFAFLGEEEPDVTLDDVTFRNYKRANSIRIIDPQPPFGIPLGPITAAPATDYLHSKPSEHNYRPIFGHLKTPDVVSDDIAFRNLRKDLGQEPGTASTKDWTPRLFSPNRENVFNYPKVKDGKKLRAIRSLSANITHMLPYNNSGAAGSSPFQQQQYSHHQHHPHQQQRFEHGGAIGKWNSFGDLRGGSANGGGGASSSSTPPPFSRASTYLQPSWVEQIEKVQTSTETLTDHRNAAAAASRLATAILDPPEHWERKYPKKTVDLTPPIYDPAKPRRPWTDIILESFEKEKQKELERIAAEAEAAAAAEANNKTEAKNELEMEQQQQQDELVDDDVFVDAVEETNDAVGENATKNNDLEEAMKQQDKMAAILSSGQKPRRGSWVEPSRSFSSSSAAAIFLQPSHHQLLHSSSHHHQLQQQQDKRRKSWSDLPKDIHLFSSASSATVNPEAITMLSGNDGSSCTPSPSTRKLFNPLPPPKKIRQINLEAFSSNSNSSSCENQSDSVPVNSTTNNLSSSSSNAFNQFEQAAAVDNNGAVQSSQITGKLCQEDELNELMDQLLKDADACGQPIETEKDKKIIKGGTADNKCISSETPAAATKASRGVNALRKEMKMDDGEEEISSSNKQDLSCVVVGIIPKQQSPPPASAFAAAAEHRPSERSLNRKVEDGDAGSGQFFKMDTSFEKGNGTSSVPKEEQNALSSSAADDDDEVDPYQLLEQRRKRKMEAAAKAAAAAAAAAAASSIEDLIESINESLPELEAIGGGGDGSTTDMITTASSSSDRKPNGSSSASGSPASSIPSPSPGSPTPPAVLSVSLLKKEVESPSSSSAFPVAAKRHHLPAASATTKGSSYSGGKEESLYENISVVMMESMLMKHSTATRGNDDEKVCTATESSLPPFSYAGVAMEESGDTDPYHHHHHQVNKASKEKIARALHDRNNDEDDSNEVIEEEDAQHSSSHQPSSLSSNDSSDVSGGGDGSSPREKDHDDDDDNQSNKQQQHHHQIRQKKDNTNNTNNISKDDEEDSNNKFVEECFSSTSAPPPTSSSLLPSSVPLVVDTTSTKTPASTISSSDNLTFSTSQPPQTISRRMSGSSIASSVSSASSSSSSTREAMLRKKSEGLKKSHSSSEQQRDTWSESYKSSSRQLQNNNNKSYPVRAGEMLSLVNPLQQLQQRAPITSGSKSKKSPAPSSSSRSSLSPAATAASDEIPNTKITCQGRRKEQQQPVARSRTSVGTSFSTNCSNNTAAAAAKKSATSTALASSSTRTSTPETGNGGGGGGMNFLRNNFPFFRTNSTSRSRSQSVVSDVSRSSETGDSKKEKDKSYRRKSHLNRAFTDEPVPDCHYSFDATPKSSKPTSQDPSSLESSAAEDSHHHHHHRANYQPKLAVKLHPTIPSVLTSNSSKVDGGNQQTGSPSNKSNQNEQQSISSPVPLPTTNPHKSSPVVKKDSFSDAEGVSFIKKMLQKESDRDRAAAAAAVPNCNGNNNSSSSFNSNTDPTSVGYNIKKSPSAGNQSYWSKFSSSQSAFLRKLFEKPKVSAESSAAAAAASNNNNLNQAIKTSNCSSTKSAITTAAAACNGESGVLEDPPNEKQRAESVLGFSVAQKASFFMKLEHDQRFSKWRKNSIDLGIIASGGLPPNTTTATFSAEDQENARLLNYSGGARNFNNESKPKSRFLTRPVTPSEGSSVGISSSSNVNSSERSNMEFGSLPRIWGNNFQPLENVTVATAVVDGSSDETKAPLAIPASSCTDYDDKHHKFNEISTRNLEPISPFTIQPTPPEVKSYSLTRSGRNTGKNNNFQNNLGGSFPMYHSASAIINTTDPATAIAAPSSNGIEKHSNNNNNNSKPGMRLHKNLTNAYSSSSSSFSEAMSNRQEIISAAKYPLTNNSVGTPIKNGICSHGGDPLTIFGNKYEDKRRGSASDLEMSGATSNNQQQQSPLMPRSDKAKSMFISTRNGISGNSKYHCDSDNLSEDGEVSSGGQEVADIICRSYENSPVFRKKNWRTQKAAHSNFTKEIWRRCGNYESWSHRNQPQQPHRHPVPQTFTATTNVIEVTTIPPTLPSVAASPPPTTSNLLQILTVLSSSNDELSEPKPKSKKHRGASRERIGGGGCGSSSSRADSIPPIHPNHTVVLQPRANSTANHPFYINNSSSKNSVSAGPINKSSNNHFLHHHPQMSPTVKVDADEIFVSVPHPEDEAFQSFFCSVKSYTQVSHYPPANGVIIASSSSLPHNNGMQQQQQDHHNGIIGAQAAAANETLDMSSVPRESDLLVMKKNVPPCKRKSTGGKYKNPLRALAARMDFRQQGYTQAHSSNNSIQCGSDVDVST